LITRVFYNFVQYTIINIIINHYELLANQQHNTIGLTIVNFFLFFEQC